MKGGDAYEIEELKRLPYLESLTKTTGPSVQCLVFSLENPLEGPRHVSPVSFAGWVAFYITLTGWLLYVYRPAVRNALKGFAVRYNRCTGKFRSTNKDWYSD